jgi:hypothetical protein
MTRIILLTLVLLGTMASSALAGSKLLILHSEGRADAKTRSKVDTAIVKLAKTGPDLVTPGEITFSEAAAMVGCRAEDPTCAGEVITTLAVDELIIVTVSPKPPDGYEIKVRRTGKGTTKDGSVTVSVDKLDKLEALAPMFGGKAPPPAFEPPGGPTKPVGPEPPPAVTTKPPVEPPVVTKPPVTTDKPTPDLTPMNPTEPAKPVVETQRSDKQPRDRRRLYIGGMITGGAMVFLGVILWSTASAVQGQIDEAPTRTKADIDDLRDLERKADSLAGWGNFFALGGLVVGGVATYFYVKHQRTKPSRSRTASFAPALFDRGAGVTLTFGGTP